MNNFNNFRIQRPVIVPNSQPSTVKHSPTANNDFQKILNEKIAENGELKISKHAENRMRLRNVNLSKEQMDRVNMAVSKADEKGVKDSLVLVDDIALVISISNRTIVTAMDSNELKENVFTNIDGAVII